MRVALVCFNRPDYLFRVLSALQIISNNEPLDIIVGVDAPRVDSESDTSKVAEVHKLLAVIADSGNFRRFVVRAREKNLGCWANKKLTISEAFEDAEHVLVLEDDIVPCADSMNFLRKMVTADVFSNERLFQVSLFSYFFPAGMDASGATRRMHDEGTLNLFGFRNWATPWGWLIRRDRWGRICDQWNGWDQWLGKFCADNEMFEIYPLVSKCNNIGMLGMNRNGDEAVDFQKRSLVSDDVAFSFGEDIFGKQSTHPLCLNYASVAHMDASAIQSFSDAVYRYGVSLHPEVLVGTGVF